MTTERVHHLIRMTSDPVTSCLAGQPASSSALDEADPRRAAYYRLRADGGAVFVPEVSIAASPTQQEGAGVLSAH
jgi:hypothetical protein